jgi:hypothetical protein
MKRTGITFLAALAMLTLWTLARPAKTHGDVLASTMTPQGSPCFNVDPGIGNPSRDDHYRWAQQRDSNVLMNNLAWKIGIIFNCSSVNGDQLASGFGAMSGIIGDYVSNPACFNNDVAVTGRDRSAHERWARTKSREQVRDNLQWKAVAAMKCLNRDQQVAFFADESAALAKIPSGNGGGGGGGTGGAVNGRWNSTASPPVNIVQNGETWTWTVEGSNEPGRGTIQGDYLKATWGGGASASGTITRRDSSGNAKEIRWSNGVVFSRQ